VRSLNQLSLVVLIFVRRKPATMRRYGKLFHSFSLGCCRLEAGATDRPACKWLEEYARFTKLIPRQFGSGQGRIIREVAFDAGHDGLGNFVLIGIVA
jgi:hypothetical protein